jgi:hypothetical protein
MGQMDFLAFNALAGADPDSERVESFADEISRLSDTILASERLCLLSARGLADCAIDRADKSVTFIPGVSKNLLSEPDIREHRTTSAQCVTALQNLLPVMGRFQLGTHESKGLAFHPIERGAAKAFKLDELSTTLRDKIYGGLKALGSLPAKPEEGATLPAFHEHPFRAALVLRATTPSNAIFSDAWWYALFIVVWYLHQRSGHSRGLPNIHATASPGTAFLTSRCVDAIEMVLTVFRRRHDRFRRLTELLLNLGNARRERNWLAALEKEGVVATEKPDNPVIRAGYRYRTAILIPEARACLEELACDSALPSFYRHWLEALKSKNTKTSIEEPQSEDSFKSAEAFLAEVIDCLDQARTNSDVSKESSDIKTRMSAEDSILVAIDKQVALVGNIHNAIKSGSGGDTGRLDHAQSLEALPAWICSADYRMATERVLKHGDAGDALELLEAHWKRHREASENARKTIREFKLYLEQVLVGLDTLSASDHADGATRIDTFLDRCDAATVHLPAIRRQLLNDLEPGARWSETVLNRHLAYAASGAVTQFDPSELAHALKVVCRDGGRMRYAIILKALHTICAAQRPDGTWNCEQPFHWTENGTSMSPMSVEIASAVVAAVNMLVMNPERYGASQVEIATGLGPVNATLDRFFRWLSGSIQTFPLPMSLRKGKKSERTEPVLYGWCSDRVNESERIHSWATAAAIELLVDFRRLLQERINLLLRVEFISHHPSELTPLSKVDPTDLGKVVNAKRDHGPLIKQLMGHMREHRRLELAEGFWLPQKPPAADISFWSGLFYGPPGTSKTFLAEAIAAELNWPLISVNPSDFLSKGNDLIEARAQEIFSAFRSASRVVIFFDEIDELIRDRSDEKDGQRSALSFLTPSFLTKLQDLRKAAKKNEFIFILATNYKDRIDSAAIRSGRVDQSILVVYPDAPARANLLLSEIRKMRGKINADEFAGTYLRRLQPLLKGIKIDKDELKKKSAQTFSADVFGFFAASAGFLSYQRIQEVIKVYLASQGGREGQQRLDDLSGEQDRLKDLFEVLCEINGAGSPRFKPEISLREYAHRPAAIAEASELIQLIPDRRAASRGPTQRAQQIAAMYEAADKDQSFRGDIEKIYRAMREAHKQREKASLDVLDERWPLHIFPENAESATPSQ